MRRILETAVGFSLISVLFLSFVNLTFAGVVFATVGPNVEIDKYNDPNQRQQAEPTIAIDPTNDQIIVAGSQNLRGFPIFGNRWHGFYRSTDGGKTWTLSLLPGFPTDTSPEGLASPIHGFDFTSDPVLAFDNLGNVFYVGLAGNLTAAKMADEIFVAKYTNHGATYASTTVVFSKGFNDKPWIAVDNTGGPNNGNVYVAWSTTAHPLSQASESIVFSRSTDHGATFSAPIDIMKHPIVGFGIGAQIAVTPSGEVFVSWETQTLSGRGWILFAKSVDGGLTFGKDSIVQVVTPIPNPLPGNLFRTFTLPSIAADQNGVYIVWDDFRTGDAEVLFTKTVDGGNTWTAPIRVNDVATNNQFLPSISTSGGNIHVIFYDSRNDPNDKLLDVYYAESVDGGKTFLPNLRVTSVSFDPNICPRFLPGSIIFIGDYIQVASTPGAVHAIWTDNRDLNLTADLNTGRLDQDVFTDTITQ